MVVSTDSEYRGRKQKVGAPLLNNSGRLHFFVGYCDNCHGKCMVTSEEAVRLMRMFYRRQHKPMQRIALKILKRYAYESSQV